MDTNEKNAKFPLQLFFSLMLLSFTPFLYTLLRTNLIANIPFTDGLGIAGHIEWFDLINETIQAFLIVPLYSLMNQCMRDRKKLKERIFQSFLIVNIVYASFSVLVLIRCNDIVSAMTSNSISDATKYLQLETIGFIIANMVSFANVLFVVLNKSLFIYTMVFLKTVFTMIGDLYWIPQFGINGVAYSNIAVNSVCVALCLIAIIREKLIAVSFAPDKSFFKSYLFTGSFCGLQILLDNIIYSSVVCKMVNETAEQGNYWTANNIIWGLLLIPITALAEIIKKDCKEERTRAKMKSYHAVILATFLIWLCFIPILKPFLRHVMGIENSAPIQHIIIVLLPFYLTYNYTVLFDNIFIGYGKTHYCFLISMIVNLVYYPIIYGLTLKGVFTPNITFLCMMFGFGMVTHLNLSILCFMFCKRIPLPSNRCKAQSDS